MKNIKINLFGLEFSDTKAGFLKKLDYYDEAEAKTDNFSFDYSDNGYTAQFENDEWSISGNGVESAAQLISEYVTKESYVLQESWLVGYDGVMVFEVCFLNCECPDHFKKYYKYGIFVLGLDNKLVEASSDYFEEISDAFDDGEENEIDSYAEAYELSEWKEAFPQS